MAEETKKPKGRMKGDTIIWAVFFFLCMVSIIEVFSASAELTDSKSYMGPRHVARSGCGVSHHHHEHRLPLLQDNHSFRTDILGHSAADNESHRRRDKWSVTMVRHRRTAVPAIRACQGSSSARRGYDSECAARRRHR